MNHLIDYAKSFLGVPYKWGGNSPLNGVDCSGLVQCILKSVGLDPKGDQTAQDLYNHFESIASSNAWGPGALAFFGESVTKITHIAFCIDQYRMIEAGGGDSRTNTFQDAIDKDARVRMSLIASRNDLVAIIKPRYSTIGLV